MLYQFGRFFFFLGLILLILFIGLFSAGESPIGLALSTAGLLVVGTWLMVRNHPKPQDTDRFHTLRKLQDKGKNKSKK